MIQFVDSYKPFYNIIRTLQKAPWLLRKTKRKKQMINFLYCIIRDTVVVIVS